MQKGGAERRAHEAAANAKRRAARFAHEDAHCGGFRRVVPPLSTAPTCAETSARYEAYAAAAEDIGVR
jgi:hypothetical protein